MKDTLTVFDVCFPGILLGMILAGAVVGVGDTTFPDAFQKLFPRQKFLLLAVVAASVICFVNLLLASRQEEESPKHISTRFRPGGPDAD